MDALVKLQDIADRPLHSVLVSNGYDAVEVCGNTSASLEWIKSYFRGYYHCLIAGTPDFRISVVQDDRLAKEFRRQAAAGTKVGCGKTYQKQLAEIYLAAGCRIYCYLKRAAAVVIPEDKSRMIFLTSGEDPERQYEPARHLREYFSRMLERRGWIILHAGVVARDGAGIAFVGAKGSGKSTSIAAMLGWPGTDFIANDRAYVGLAGGRFKVLSWATTAKIGVGTAYASLPLREWLKSTAVFSYPQEESTAEEREYFLRSTSDSERWSAKQKIELTPAEVTRTFGGEIQALANLDLIVFPRVTPQVDRVEVTELDESAAQAILNHQCFTPQDDSYPDWIGLRLEDIETIESRRVELVRRLSLQTPMRSVRYSSADDLRWAVSQQLNLGSAS